MPPLGLSALSSVTLCLNLLTASPDLVFRTGDSAGAGSSLPVDRRLTHTRGRTWRHQAPQSHNWCSAWVTACDHCRS